MKHGYEYGDECLLKYPCIISRSEKKVTMFYISGVYNKGVGLCDEAVPVQVGQRVGGIRKTLPVRPVANEGLYIEEYTCSTICLCILQFTHDRFQAFG